MRMKLYILVNSKGKPNGKVFSSEFEAKKSLQEGENIVLGELYNPIIPSEDVLSHLYSEKSLDEMYDEVNYDYSDGRFHD